MLINTKLIMWQLSRLRNNHQLRRLKARSNSSLVMHVTSSTLPEQHRTLRAYASDWADFESFCRRLALGVLPADPATVGLYIAEMAAVRQLAASTIGRRMAAISVLHVEAGHPSPTAHPQVRRLMTGTRRTLGVEQHGKRALTPVELRRMIAALGDDLASQRDQAMMLVGFVGGLRRSELVAINVGDLKLTEDGYVLTVRRSKTDQEAKTRRVALPYSPTRCCALCGLFLRGSSWRDRPWRSVSSYSPRRPRHP